jgi:hypothetical protein
VDPVPDPLLCRKIIAPNSLILVTLMMEAISSSETSFLQVPQRNIPEDGILNITELLTDLCQSFLSYNGTVNESKSIGCTVSLRIHMPAPTVIKMLPVIDIHGDEFSSFR